MKTEVREIVTTYLVYDWEALPKSGKRQALKRYRDHLLNLDLNKIFTNVTKYCLRNESPEYIELFEQATKYKIVKFDFTDGRFHKTDRKVELAEDEEDQHDFGCSCCSSYTVKRSEANHLSFKGNRAQQSQIFDLITFKSRHKKLLRCVRDNFNLRWRIYLTTHSVPSVISREKMEECNKLILYPATSRFKRVQNHLLELSEEFLELRNRLLTDIYKAALIEYKRSTSSKTLAKYFIESGTMFDKDGRIV